MRQSSLLGLLGIIVMVVSSFMSAPVQAQPYTVNVPIWGSYIRNHDQLWIGPRWSDHLSLRADWDAQMETKFTEVEDAHNRFRTAREMYMSLMYVTELPASLELTFQEQKRLEYLYQIVGEEPYLRSLVISARQAYVQERSQFQAVIDSAFAVGFPTEAARDAKVAELNDAEAEYTGAADALYSIMNDYKDLVGRQPTNFYGTNINWGPIISNAHRFNEIITFLNSKADAIEAACAP